MIPAPVERRIWGVLSYVGAPQCLPRPGQGTTETALVLAPEDIGYEYEAGGAHALLSPPEPQFTLDARPGAESPCCPHVPRRESPPAGQKTPDSGHVSQEPKSENSSTQSSPEMPTTKNRLGLGARQAGGLWVVGSAFIPAWA